MTCFERNVESAAPIGKVGEIGDLVYTARNYTPDVIDLTSSELSVFTSPELKEMVCGLLGTPTNDDFMLGSHRHDPPSTDGWPHSDCAVVSFPKEGPKLAGLNVFQPDSGCNYADDSKWRQPDSRKVARAVACIYYLGSEDWQDGDGGETAIYGLDGKTVVAKIPPVHNSLFAFEISPVSYHGYIASPRKRRDSYIWWYHCELPDLVERSGDAFHYRIDGGQEPWDRWTDKSVEKFEHPLVRL